MNTPCPPPPGATAPLEPASLSSSPLTEYGRMAEKHWREFLPKMVAELEARNQLHAMLLEAEQQTERELDQIRQQLMQRGQTPQQAQHQAWETVRERYIFLPPEN